MTGPIVTLFIRGIRGCKCGSFSDRGRSICHLGDFCGVLSTSRLLLCHVSCCLGDGLLGRFLGACRQVCSLILLTYDISDSLVLVGGALVLHFILHHHLVSRSTRPAHRA